MEIGFQTHTTHPDWVGDALLIIHGVFLWDDVQNFVAGRQHQFVHVVNETLNVFVRNFRVVVVTGKDATVLQTLDVLTRNADVDARKFRLGVAFSRLDGFRNGIDRFFDVGYDATHDANAFNFSDAEDFEFAVFIFATSNGAHFSCANVQCNYQIGRQ